MRNIIIDSARERLAERRGGDSEHVDLDGDEAMQVADTSTSQELIRVSEALLELEAIDPELAELVDMRYFGGYTEVEIAELQGVTERTIRRRWDKARAWLYVALNDAAAGRAVEPALDPVAQPGVAGPALAHLAAAVQVAARIEPAGAAMRRSLGLGAVSPARIGSSHLRQAGRRGAARWLSQQGLDRHQRKVFVSSAGRHGGSLVSMAASLRSRPPPHHPADGGKRRCRPSPRSAPLNGGATPRVTPE